MAGDWTSYDPPEATAPVREDTGAPYGGEASFETYDPDREQARLRRTVASLVAVVVGGVVAAGITAVTIVKVAGSDAPSPPPAAAPPAAPAPLAAEPPRIDAFSTESRQAMLAALRDATGSTQVIDAVMFPEQIIVNVLGPDPDGPRHMYTWNGELAFFDETEAYGRSFDLARLAVDFHTLCPADLDDCVAEVKRPYDDSESWVSVTDMGTYQRRGYDLAGNPD